MLGRAIAGIVRQLQRLLVVAIVLLAAYVSAGRQFMPAVADYTDFVEERLLELTGLPVSIRSLTGSFSGFNPSVEISGLSLLVTEAQVSAQGQDAGLLFDSAFLTLDVPASIWQRRLVFEDFEVADVSLALQQSADGAWQLRGLTGASPQQLDVDELYSALLGVAFLKVSNVSLLLQPSSGEPVELTLVDARIQNLAGEHVLNLDVRLPNAPQLLQFSYEGRGDSIEAASGFAYANIPANEYLQFLEPLLPTTLVAAVADVVTLRAGAELWLQLEDGGLVEATTTLNLDSLQLRRGSSERAVQSGEVTELANFRGVASVRRSKENALAGGRRPLFEFVVQATQGTWDGKAWEPFSAGLVLRQNDELELRADSLDLGRMLGLTSQLAEVGFLPIDAQALETLDALAPRGRLRNLALKIEGEREEGSPLDVLSNPIASLSLRANTESVAIDSVGGIPSLSGITGYLESSYDGAEGMAQGFAEVDSTAVGMNLPNVFTRDWRYDYVNGRIDFVLRLGHGLDLQLLSNTIVAESELTRGRVKFGSRLRRAPNAEPQAELELLVGVESMDARERYLYLPDGAKVADGLKATMEWVGGAVQSGVFTDSGAIFRGSTVAGAPPASKTFQGFYRLDEASITYAEGWPAIAGARGFVTTADSIVDVALERGSSLGLQLGSASGTVRPALDDEGVVRNLLLVEGGASGLTSDALHFLASSPLPSGLTDTVATWEADGRVDLSLGVELLLGTARAVDVRTEMRLADNTLRLNEYGLRVSDLQGEVVFDTRTGLESEALSGSLFDAPVRLALGSQAAESGQLTQISVDASGSATSEDFVDLAITGSVLDGMLRQAEGRMDFDARLEIEQNGESDYPVTLHLNSGLAGVGIDAPKPLGKTRSESTDFDVSLGFGAAGEWVRGQLGTELEFDLSFEAGQLSQGIVYVGESPTSLEALKQSPYSSLVVLGAVERLEFEEWRQFADRLTAAIDTASAAGPGSMSQSVFASTVGFLDLEVSDLSLLGQSFANLSLRIQPDLDADRWLIDLAGPELEGHVESPFDAGELLVSLQRLRIAGGEETLSGPQLQAEEAVSAVDVLAEFDPRTFPALRFSTKELKIGDRDYGSWRFHLAPSDAGAAFSELAFDFRGLRLNPESLESERIDSWEEGDGDAVAPAFRWHFDGVEHRSEFSGRLTVTDLAEVLRENGYAASLESTQGSFDTQLSWPGSPAFFSADALSGEARFEILEGRFLQGASGAGALKLISILNFDAVMRRLRFSDDLLRSGLAFDRIEGHLLLDAGQVEIQDRLVISGPSSLYQITGDVDLVNETIVGEMYVTLPVSNNIPWLGLLTANIPIAVGAYLFDQIFGDQVDSLTSAAYTLDGPWEGLEPKFRQAFGSPEVAPSNGQQATQ